MDAHETEDMVEKVGDRDRSGSLKRLQAQDKTIGAWRLRNAQRWVYETAMGYGSA